MTGAIPRPATPEGRAGLDALLTRPGEGLIGLDFDGTLSPIVAHPADARAHPGAVPALSRLAGSIGTLAIITGRPAAEAVELGGFGRVPGLVVLGHYGLQRWQGGELTSPEPPPAIETARQALPQLLRDVGAPDGTRIEEKAQAVAVHTRGTTAPDAALDAIREPLTKLATDLGLAAEPGRLVIELRPRGVDKGAALKELVRETTARSVIFCGDDLGDLAAFAAVGELRAAGTPGCAVASGSHERPEVAAAADLVVDGPQGIVEFLDAVASRVSPGR
jgi:trehalose 6-phosphate phosphatase